MKKVVLLIGLILILGGCQNPPVGKDLYGYSFNSARISYQISGSSSGTSEVLIKNDKKLIHNDLTKTSLDGTETKIDSTTIQDGEMIYSLNNLLKTGVAVPNPLYRLLQQMSAADRQKTLLQEAVRTTDQNQETTPQSEGEKQIAGQTCKIYKNANGSACIWENIPLENVVSLPQFGINLTTVATKIDLNVEINDQEFGLPSDYKVTVQK